MQKGTKTLYLLRHAKAEPGGAHLEDKNRALSGRGREACQRIGEYMRAQGLKPDVILSSDSRRTQETVKRVCDAAGMEPEVFYTSKLYLATAGDILAAVQEAPENTDSLMIVGHNPGMHHAALLLAHRDDSDLRLKLELKYPTGALCVLGFEGGHWRAVAQGNGNIKYYILPQEDHI